jgi:hypothetical protein
MNVVPVFESAVAADTSVDTGVDTSVDTGVDTGVDMVADAVLVECYCIGTTMNNIRCHHFHNF